MNLEILVENNIVYIVEADNHNNIEYDIAIEELGYTIPGNISDWINQLNDRIGFTNDILYKLAKVIQEYAPGNNIDWHATFFMVEKSSYLDHVSDLKNNPNEKKTRFEKFVIDKMKMGQEEDNEEINSLVQSIVDQKLKNYGIL